MLVLTAARTSVTKIVRNMPLVNLDLLEKAQVFFLFILASNFDSRSAFEDLRSASYFERRTCSFESIRGVSHNKNDIIKAE
jgi:hypothetical protein